MSLMKFTFSPMPDLLPGERILHLKKVVWAGSFKCPPNYRWFFSLPPCLEAGLIVTDRRVLVVCYLLRMCALQVIQWYPQRQPIRDEELISIVSVGRGPLLGDYLEVLSENPRKHWYRSRALRVRLYMRNPESVRRTIAEALAGSAVDTGSQDVITTERNS